MLNKKLLLQAGEGALIVLIILTIIGGSVLYFRKGTKTATQPKATPGVPTLTFVTEPATVNSGEDFNLILKINPNGAEFHAFELYAKYDGIKVEPQDSINPSANVVSSYPLISSTVDPATSTITIIGTRTGSSFTGNQAVEIARVKLKKKSDANGGIIFSWEDNSKLGNKLPLQKLDSTL